MRQNLLIEKISIYESRLLREFLSYSAAAIGKKLFFF